MKRTKKVSNIPPMSDKGLGKFWDGNGPEDEMRECEVIFARTLRLEPRDIRIIDRESKRSGIDRAQLVRSWVKEKIRRIEIMGSDLK